MFEYHRSMICESRLYMSEYHIIEFHVYLFEYHRSMNCESRLYMSEYHTSTNCESRHVYLFEYHRSMNCESRLYMSEYHTSTNCESRLHQKWAIKLIPLKLSHILEN
uniref:Uncharacterized protein n=1 Tax=Wuchereria bancrofti TaxID=6293 RepID=A0AAF5RTM4_WUCBA